MDFRKNCNELQRVVNAHCKTDDKFSITIFYGDQTKQKKHFFAKRFRKYKYTIKELAKTIVNDFKGLHDKMKFHCLRDKLTEQISAFLTFDMFS